MKIFKIFSVVLGLIAFLPFGAEAQRDVYNWQITPYAGLLTLSNDVAVPDDINTYAYGLRLERRLGNSFTAGLHVAQLQIDSASQNNVTGGFLSLGYLWDNGYLFSRRATVALFHRIEVGYADRYSTFQSINGKSADVAFGFENGIKFRFGDRISADVAVEILGSKASLTSGDVIENMRYNVWKFGLTYHFGSRKSSYVAPVFVPYNGIPFGKPMLKMDTKDENIWIVNDSIYNTKVKERRVYPQDKSDFRPQLSRADSILIFMHFDSLYQKRSFRDTTDYDVDVFGMDSVEMTLIPDSSMAGADSVSTGELEKSIRDSTYVPLIGADSFNRVERDTSYIRKSAVSTDSIMEIKVDTISVPQSAIPADSVKIMRVDTIYIPNVKPDQKPDTAAKADNTPIPPARVDTIYLVQDFSQTKSNDALKSESGDNKATDRNDTEKNSANQKSTEGDDKAFQRSIAKQNQLLAQQNADIQANQREIARLRSENNKKSGTGKVIAAGATGALLGAALSGDKSQKPDTVYYESAAAQLKLDSLKRELAALKLQYGITDSIPAVSTNIDYVPNPPIGMYFENDSGRTDSLVNTFFNSSDSAVLASDSIHVSSDSVSQNSSQSSYNKKFTSNPESLQKSEPADSINIPGSSGSSSASSSLMAEYPVSCSFGLNKTDLTSEELKNLDPVVNDLKNDLSRSVLLTGYTDSSGNADYNLQLSKKRAKTVEDYLISKGISAERITIRGNGVMNSSDTYSQNSRRVDITLE